VLATAGGLVFTGDTYGNFIAFDAKTGKVLWRFQTGASIFAPPVTYTFEGKQYIALPAGSALLTFGLP
jgi:glucose dehydrogenase